MTSTSSFHRIPVGKHRCACGQSFSSLGKLQLHVKPDLQKVLVPHTIVYCWKCKEMTMQKARTTFSPNGWAAYVCQICGVWNEIQIHETDELGRFKWSHQ